MCENLLSKHDNLSHLHVKCVYREACMGAYTLVAFLNLLLIMNFELAQAVTALHSTCSSKCTVILKL